MKAAIFILLFFLFAGSAYAYLQGATIQGATLQGWAATVVSSTNSLLLEDGFYLLQENGDTFQLES